MAGLTECGPKIKVPPTNAMVAGGGGFTNHGGHGMQKGFVLVICTPIMMLALPWQSIAQERVNCAPEPGLTAIRPGMFLTGTHCVISPVRDADNFAFAGQAGDVVTVTMKSGGINPCGQIVDPDGV